MTVEESLVEQFANLADNIIIPCLCIFGLVGNSLSLLVFSRRYLERSTMHAIEVSSTLGLLTLAGIDLCFCLVTLVASCLTTHQIIHKHKGLSFYYELYGSALQNALIKVLVTCL